MVCEGKTMLSAQACGVKVGEWGIWLGEWYWSKW